MPKENIRAKSYVVLERAHRCEECSEVFQTFAFAVPGSHEEFQVDDEDPAYDEWREGGSPAVLHDVEYIPVQVQREMEALTKTFRRGKNVYGTYWMNHCPHCGAAQGDDILHDADGSTFVLQTPSEVENLTFHRIRKPFSANASLSWNTWLPDEDDLWDSTPAFAPLCPPASLDGLDAFKKLHEELRQWVVTRGYKAAEIEFWDESTVKKKGRAYCDEVVAQIAWLTGPDGWAVGLWNGRSFSGTTWKHKGKRCFLEPADGYVVSLRRLD